MTRLARALLGLRGLASLPEAKVDELVSLWSKLPDFDKSRVVYPPRHQTRLVKGQFKASKGKTSTTPGKESLQR